MTFAVFRFKRPGNETGQADVDEHSHASRPERQNRRPLNAFATSLDRSGKKCSCERAACCLWSRPHRCHAMKIVVNPSDFLPLITADHLKCALVVGNEVYRCSTQKHRLLKRPPIHKMRRLFTFRLRSSHTNVMGWRKAHKLNHTAKTIGAAVEGTPKSLAVSAAKGRLSVKATTVPFGKSSWGTKSSGNLHGDARKYRRPVICTIGSLEESNQVVFPRMKPGEASLTNSKSPINPVAAPANKAP
jgi:hypothetical protein